MSVNYKELFQLFQTLPEDEQNHLVSLVKDKAADRSISLNDLVRVKQDRGIECPYCRRKDHIVKFGVRRGIQWFKCKDCGHTFSPLSDSILNSTKKDLRVWKAYINCMLDGLSVRKAADACGINRNTAFVWRHKILDALMIYAKRRKLNGVIEADDTYFRLSYKGSTPPNRSSFKRGEASPKRGISKDKVCVSCAIDRNGNIFSKISSLGRASAKALSSTFGKRMAKKSVLCTDKERAYHRFAAEKGLKLVQIKDGKKKLGVYHIQHVNSYHSRLKLFMTGFRGVATKYLNNYIVWHNVVKEGRKGGNTILKLVLRAVVLTQWLTLSQRPAVPLPV